MGLDGRLAAEGGIALAAVDDGDGCAAAGAGLADGSRVHLG